MIGVELKGDDVAWLNKLDLFDADLIKEQKAIYAVSTAVETAVETPPPGKEKSEGRIAKNRCSPSLARF